MDALPMIDSALSYSPATSSVMASLDEDDMTLEAKQCLSALKEGKRSVSHLQVYMYIVTHIHTYTSTVTYMHTYFDQSSGACMQLGIAPALLDHHCDPTPACCTFHSPKGSPVRLPFLPVNL